MAMIKLKDTPGHVVEVKEENAHLYKPCPTCKTSGNILLDSSRTDGSYMAVMKRCWTCRGVGFVNTSEVRVEVKYL